MKILEPGIEFFLEDFKDPEKGQVVRFTAKDPVLGGYIPGTTNEEVFDMMIERFYELQKKRFSTDNQMIIAHLKDCRRLSKKRISNKRTRLQKHGITPSNH